METKLNETEVCEKLKFTPNDILVKRDIDFINSIKYPDKFKQRNKFWNEYTRDEKAELIMKYIEEIELTDKYGNRMPGRNEAQTYLSGQNRHPYSCPSACMPGMLLHSLSANSLLQLEYCA